MEMYSQSQVRVSLSKLRLVFIYLHVQCCVMLKVNYWEKFFELEKKDAESETGSKQGLCGASTFVAYSRAIN